MEKKINENRESITERLKHGTVADVSVATGFSCPFEKYSLASSDRNSLDSLGFLMMVLIFRKEKRPCALGPSPCQLVGPK